MAGAELYRWLPSLESIAGANVSRLMGKSGATTIDEMRQKSVSDVSAFWDSVVEDLQLPFRQPYTCVLDLTRGPEFPEWFVDGRLNIVDACLQRWADDPSHGHRRALVHENEGGDLTTVSYAELRDLVQAASRGLARLGIGKGDAVATYMPMSPEAVIACYAIVRLGAVLVPLFSGFAPGAVATRIQDAEACAVVVAAETVRRGRTIDMYASLDEALGQCPSVRHVVVVGEARQGPGPALAPGPTAGRDIAWSELMAGTGPVTDTCETASMDALLLAYTSGTTGSPKGAVHTHAGFLVKVASELAYAFDVKPDDVFTWITDMGWIMGPLSVFGVHANGATLLLYEGSPDVPDANRLWEVVQRNAVSVLGVSPTLVRTLRSDPVIRPTDFDLSSVRVLGATGEPWDPDSYEWLAAEAFERRAPVINFSGGTEVGGSFLCPYPIEPISSCSLGGPSLGMDVDVVDANGQSVRGEVGELVCRQPWPSMSRGIWKDPERYLQTYWSTYAGLWHHGDFARADPNGEWYVLGRSDDVMNVAGKRLAPAEVEAVLNAHGAVAESAVVGIPDSGKGEAIYAVWVGATDGGPDVSAELRELVGQELGKPFTPTTVRRVEQLPKTRSAKIMRRAVRAAVMGDDPGDLSGAENPGAVDAIRRAFSPIPTR